VAASLSSFFAAWIEPLFPRDEQQRILESFAFLVDRAFTDPIPQGRRRSNLCADGTPLEMSLALDDRGRWAIRFVCDVAAADASDGDSIGFHRYLADRVIPDYGSRAAELDWLFARHLSGALESSRFRVWYGMGFAPGQMELGKLYFNTEWLSSIQVQDIMARLLSPEVLDGLVSIPLLETEPYAGVGYDFDHVGLRKLKVYVRPAEFNVGALVRSVGCHCSGRESSFRQILDRVADARGSPYKGNFVASAGQVPRLAKREFKVYLPLAAWGIRDFASTAPLLQAILAGWGFRTGALDTATGPARCVPTLLAIGVDDDRELASIYFKPELDAKECH